MSVRLSWSWSCVLLLAASAVAMPRVEEDWPAPRVDEQGVVRAAAWLGLPRVDATGRRPFRPDAVLREHVLPGRAPRAGQERLGELGEAGTWERRDADDGGGPGGGVGWAYTALHLDAPRVVLARLAGASTLWVNGEAFTGDVYRFGQDGVPVALLAGRNDVYVTGIRGAFRLGLHPADGALLFGGKDLTRPDLVHGADGVGPVGVPVLNASTAATGALHVSSPGDGLFAPLDVVVRGLGPLGMRKLALPLALRDGARVPDDAEQWTLPLHVRDLAGGAHAQLELTLRVVAPTATRRVTFRSAMDGSAQFWGLQPLDPAADDGGTRHETHLVLSLHGAGVDAHGQARCYAPRPDRWVAAPTNRRPFGFDWQDWGRTDAYEVLHEALALSGVPRERVGLTGHSMGGHGSWHLAANDADGFSAVAPSAGWESFDTYGGRPEGSLADLWQRADQPSRTLDFLDNLAAMPVFVLHGDGDRTVSPDEGRRMLEALRGAGAEPGSHFEPGKGHWWNGPASPGTDCLDWPALSELLATSRIPQDPDGFTFVSAGPAVDSQHHWLHVEQALPGQVVRVQAEWSADERLSLSTSGALRLRIEERPGRRLRELVVDGQAFSLESAERERLEGAWVLGAVGDQPELWSPAGALRSDERALGRSGPFKRAFDREFVLVPGTQGTPAEDRALAARARYDAQVWGYRGNGRAEILTDREALSADLRGRNVILYGNADTNGAWSLLDGCPLQAERGALLVDDPSGRLDGLDLRGDDLAGAWLWAHPDGEGLVGVFADTGVVGTRLGFALPTFVSGVGFTDWQIFDPAILSLGDDGVLAAGWYDEGWAVLPEHVRGE